MGTVTGTRVQTADLQVEPAKVTPEQALEELKRRPSQKNGLRGRQNSLRRVKDSTDMLRARSLQRQQSKKDVAPDGTSGGREGRARQFTVANVGNNGMLYLRPIQKAHPNAVPKSTTFTFPSNNSSKAAAAGKPKPQADNAQARDSIWTNMSALKPSAGAAADARGRGAVETRPRRSHSHSTPGVHIAEGGLESGALKIVIDRTATVNGGNSGEFPSIEVPIPHYRLGTPRFSAMGTAFLHNSVYTKSSLNGEHADQASSLTSNAGDYERMFTKGGLEAHAILSRRHSHASVQPYSIQTAHGPSVYTSVGQQAYAIPSHSSGPISPHIYDSLAANPHDPAIVKYSSINGEIIAASPARIIAQITSENFLDYELLSDFFLTVRCYLSTHDLLSYLLARFEWAINRFDDNGRVIRVRAFAALRHWILNYFSYDFVVDRDLRVQFCDRINALTRIVKARASYGASDMKLIADLKKCWNGRCSLFWDNPRFSVDTQQDLDIQPGGVIGSRDSQLIHQSQLRFTTVAALPPGLGVSPAQLTAGTPSIANWYSAVMEHGERPSHGHHARQSSTATSRSLPLSPTSEQSMPVLSCSIPAKGFRRALPYATRTMGLHPIPATSEGRRICPAAPSAFVNEQAQSTIAQHRRSGSFSDAARDQRAPLSSEVPVNQVEDTLQDGGHYDRSLLRGYMIAPGTPYVNAVPSTPSLELPGPVIPAPTPRDGDQSGGRKGSATHHNPAVKNIIGNIRRALSSKHGPSNSPPGIPAVGNPPVPTLAVGKSATMPLNVMYQASSTGQLEHFKSLARVDLLVKEVADAYMRATNPNAEQTPLFQQNVTRESIGVASGNEREQPSPFKFPLPQENDTGAGSAEAGLLRPPMLQRLNSEMTDSSQSILIVDDTGLNVADAPQVPVAAAKEEVPAVQQQQPQPPASAAPFEADAVSPVSPNSAPLTMPFEGVRSEPNVSSVSASVPESREHSFEPQQTNNADRNGSVGSVGASERQGSAPSGPPPPRPSMVPRNHSHGNSKNGSISLRKYASFQSTFSKHTYGKSTDTSMSKVGMDATMDAALLEQTPVRGLRRRPGGDLRAHENVHDLEEFTRPRSAGSITTYSESLRESELLGFDNPMRRPSNSRRSTQQKVETAAGALPERRGPHSLVRTHSSQPERRRPSFEAAVAEFARIPDDEEGGVEVTLLKLEGKYKSPVQSPTPPTFPPGVHSPEPRLSPPGGAAGGARVEDTSGTQTPLAELGMAIDREFAQAMAYPDAEQYPTSAREQVVSALYAQSEDSYNSVPLLERGMDDMSSTSILAKGKGIADQLSQLAREHMSSGELINETMSLRRLRHGSAAPTATTDSFLLDENDEFLSDMSSELSMDTIEADHEVRAWQRRSAQTDPEDMVLVGQHHPPTPPMTMRNAMSIEEQTSQSQEQRRPPTPDPSPVAQHVEPSIPALKLTKQDPDAPRHMCFILGFDSEVIAQQMTLVEKDALKEIDWRDLVEMRWQNTATTTTNWVEYLLTQDPLGIDLVTARFNIVVKWALSEIVLTDNIEERALTMMKYIHIAQKARELHNYATLLQLTIALTSADCTRLSKTWDMVPQAEKDILQDLEMLVSPRRNFHNLRVEMEKANADQGCIPVVALYIHDLTYNSQKPAQLPGSGKKGEGEPLVNFERYRSTAVIVKNLLRLIDASAKYDYAPVEGVLEKCLWMAAMPDEAITARSKELEWRGR